VAFCGHVSSHNSIPVLPVGYDGADGFTTVFHTLQGANSIDIHIYPGVPAGQRPPAYGDSLASPSGSVRNISPGSPDCGSVTVFCAESAVRGALESMGLDRRWGQRGDHSTSWRPCGDTPHISGTGEIKSRWLSVRHEKQKTPFIQQGCGVWSLAGARSLGHPPLWAPCLLTHSHESNKPKVFIG
jgi:hypothetical protein